MLVLEISVILAWAALRTEVANINAKRVQMVQQRFQISVMQAVDQVDIKSWTGLPTVVEQAAYWVYSSYTIGHYDLTIP